MNIVFMGTPEFSVPILKMLIDEGYHVSTVVTQPDRPKGRKQVLTPSAVKVAAESYQIRIFQPEKLKHPDAVATLRELNPDFIITAAYGQILPKSILDIPRFGCINVHASLLPRYRGGAPIHHAIMRGEQVTGITIMYMNEGLDTGDMICQSEVCIRDDDTTGSMFEKLSVAGAQLLRDTIPLLVAGKITATPQNHSEAIYSPNVKREDERIDWSKTAWELSCQVRGLHPYPGAYTMCLGEVMKVWTCIPLMDVSSSEQPGTIIAIQAHGIDVSTGKGIIRLLEVQPAGKKAIKIEPFIQGTKLKIGDKLD